MSVEDIVCDFIDYCVCQEDEGEKAKVLAALNAERAEHSIKYNQLLARFREALSLLEGRITKETLQLVKEGLEE